MPRKTPPADARRWLEMSLQGQSAAQIARAERRDPRTVATAVRQLRSEQERGEIRRDALRDAYRSHWRLLLDVLDDLARAVAADHPEIGPRRPVYLEDERLLEFAGATVDLSDRDRPLVHLPLEGSVHWKLLAEHLRGDELLSRLHIWKQAVADEAGTRLALAGTVKSLLSEATGLRCGATAGPRLDPAGLDAVYSAAAQEALHDDHSLGKLSSRLKAEGGVVRVGSHALVHEDRDPEQHIAAVGSVLESLRTVAEIEELRRARRAREDAARDLVEEARIVQAGALLPGECRACRRFRP